MVIGVLAVGAALLGYAVLPSDHAFYFFPALAVFVPALVLRLLLRSRESRSWQLASPGFAAHPVRWARFPAQLAAAGGWMLTAASFGAAVRTHDFLLPEPLLLLPALYAMRLLNWSRGPILVTPDGLTVQGRLYPWADVHQAYLLGDRIQLRLRPRWVTAFGDRTRYIDGLAYDGSAPEIHWLIQHYLLFPAERSTMAALPTRAYALPA